MVMRLLSIDSLHVFDEQERQRRLADEAGDRHGRQWYSERADPLQEERILRTGTGKCGGTILDCRTVDEAILEITSIIMPRCARDIKSAKNFWTDVAGENRPHSNSIPFISGFFYGVRAAAIQPLALNVTPAVTEWLESLSMFQRVNLAQFAEKYGESWRNWEGWDNAVYPDGCEHPFHVVYFMAHGDLPYGAPCDVNRQVKAWFIDCFMQPSKACFCDTALDYFIRCVLQKTSEGGSFEEYFSDAIYEFKAVALESTGTNV